MPRIEPKTKYICVCVCVCVYICIVKLWFFQQSCMSVRLGTQKRLSTEELVLSNCGTAEVSGESLGLAKKRSVFIPVPKKGNAKECSNCLTSALISHTSKVMLKILQAMLQQYMNQKFPHVQAGFRKGIVTRDQIANICWIIKRSKGFQKNIFICFIDYAKICMWITTNCGKFLKR